MGLERPHGELAVLEDFLGCVFPDGDENACMTLGRAHDLQADRLHEPLTDGDGHVRALTATSRGEGITAFTQAFSHPVGAGNNLRDATTGIRVAGLGLHAGAQLVLAHKGLTLYYYGLAAAALASGGTMAAPAVQRVFRIAIDRMTNTAANAVLT
ncbi:MULTISPECIES: hypothetical protein [unclassified Streptosporangium]|uniref:hypothetical protein n=1 Tax=unclassified Streptosporangium TaxID=2632669 RepID=UPI002E2C57FB|nr:MULTISPECIES: hypothetical protein [unclassified Streptosporangium]